MFGDRGGSLMTPMPSRSSAIRNAAVSRDNQGGKRDNQDGKFFDGVIFEDFGSDLTR